MNHAPGYVYELPLFQFHGFITVKGAIKSMMKVHTSPYEAREHIFNLVRHAEAQVLLRSDWDGNDVTGSVRLAGLPTESIETDLMVAFKQENGDTTYIWSPLELNWLKPFSGKPWPCSI